MNIFEFKESLATINTILYFDHEDYLREKTTDETRIQQLIFGAEKLVEGLPDSEDAYFFHGTLGNLYRIIEKPKEALVYLNLCLNYAREKNDIMKEVVTLIRIGEAHKYNDNHKAALESFNLALAKCKDTRNFLDFALQHKGKCLMEIGRNKEAFSHFQQALRLRELKDDPSLVQSTKEALNYVLRSMKTETTSKIRDI